MKFFCPHCRQKLSIETLHGGHAVSCPKCGSPLTIPGAGGASASSSTPSPAPDSALPPWTEDRAAIRETLQSNIDRASLTITQFMSQRRMEGGVDLDATSASASAFLTAEQGRKYQLGDVVASGGMGSVISAKDVNLRRTVAMKVMLDPHRAGQEDVLRFIEEAQVTSQLQHPAIVPIHELGVDGQGNVFYTMKYVEGATLKDILKRLAEGDPATRAAYPLGRLLTVFQKVCDAMAFAHSKRVIHRDLKPENVMIGGFGEVVVMDWGLAKVLPRQKRKKVIKKEGAKAVVPDRRSLTVIDSVRKGKTGPDVQTLAGAIMGTPGFMAPEQASGNVDAIDQRADIYALGAILYNILTLRKSVEGDDLTAMLEKIEQGEIPDPREYNPGRRRKARAGGGAGAAVNLSHCPDGVIPESLAAVAMKAMALNPIVRYQTVQALQKEIEAYQHGFATFAERAGMGRVLGLFIRRHKGTAVAAVMIAVLLVGGFAINIRERVRAEEARDGAERSRVVSEKALRDLQGLAPVVAERSAALLEQQDLNEALKAISYAITLDPRNAEYHLRQGHIRQAMLDLPRAAQSYEQALERDPGLQSAQQNLALCRKFRKPGKPAGKLSAAELSEFYAELVAQERYAEARAMGRQISGQAAVLSSEALIRETLSKSGMAIRNITRAADGTLTLDLSRNDVSDLSLLKGMPLTSLTLFDCKQVRDLSPLKGMPLTSLNLRGCFSITDLSPLQGIPLTSLNLSGCGQIGDLSPLKGMPLTSLHVGSQISDLSPLRGMPLTSLNLDGCSRIGDLSALKGMPLTSLNLNGCRTVTDLSYLQGMPLTSLSLAWCGQISDLSPLKGMPLTSLNLSGCRAVTDLSPLQGMALTSLRLGCPKVTDISPLEGMPLTMLGLHGCGQIGDLRPLLSLSKLEHLILPGPKCGDIDFLRDKPGLLYFGSINESERLPAQAFWERFDREKAGKQAADGP